MAEGGLDRCHILLVTFPMQGHINPFMPLAARLRSLGFTLSVSISDRFCACLPQSHDYHLITYPDPHLDEKNLHDFLLSDQLVIRRPIQKTAQERSFSCIIFNLTCISWALDLAENLQTASAVFIPLSVSSFLLYDKLSILKSQVLGDAEEQKQVIFRMPGYVPLNFRDIPQFLQTVLVSDSEYEKMMERRKLLDRVTWKLVNSFQELEHDVLKAQNVPNLIPIGPLIPDSNLKLIRGSSLEEDYSCLEWLDKQAPASVLYVSFGSMSTMSVLQVEELAQGLEASNQPFLWVWRPDFVTDVPDSYLQMLKQRIEGQGMIISWAPQLQVLSHEAVGGFLTHGGWNSVLESINMGVPMIGWPCRAEQSLNCRCVADAWKIGLTFSKDGLIKKQEIKEFINILMKGEEGKEMRKRTMELGAMAKASTIEGGSSFNNLHNFKCMLLPS